MWKLVVFVILMNGNHAAIETNVHFEDKKSCISAATQLTQKMDLPEHKKSSPRCLEEWVRLDGPKI